jgi:hypothetical protein
LTDEFSNECDFYIWEESTADGYSVYIVTHNPDKINVNENVHYYDSDLKDALVEFITNAEGMQKKTIYVDDIDSDHVERAMEELYEQINK